MAVISNEGMAVVCLCMYFMWQVPTARVRLSRCLSGPFGFGGEVSESAQHLPWTLGWCLRGLEFPLLPGTVQFACKGNGRDVFLLSPEEGEGRGGATWVSSVSHIAVSTTLLKAFAVFFLLPSLLYFLRSLLMLFSVLSGSTDCPVGDFCVCSLVASHQRHGWKLWVPEILYSTDLDSTDTVDVYGELKIAQPVSSW